MMRVVGRPGARVATVVVCRSDRIVPGAVVKELCSVVGSMRPARLHSASCYAIHAWLSHVTTHGDKLVTDPLLFRFRLETLERPWTEIQ